MFMEAGFKIDRAFLKISQATLNVNVTRLNFADGLNAAETINSWVREQTNGKINEIFGPGERTHCHSHTDKCFSEIDAG